MKILVCYSNSNELSLFFEKIGLDDGATKANYKHLNIDLLETGYTVYETAFKMGVALQKETYHLVLFAGLAYSLNDKMNVGQVLNVINEKPFMIGTKNNEGFSHAYTLGWLDKTKKPHVRGGYVNMTNAYFNVFLPFMKTAALTSPVLEGNQEMVQLKTSKFPIHIESSNGLGFHYACLYQGIPFYQIRAVEYNVLTNEQDKSKAIEALNNSLNQIIDLL